MLGLILENGFTHNNQTAYLALHFQKHGEIQTIDIIDMFQKVVFKAIHIVILRTVKIRRG